MRDTSSRAKLAVEMILAGATNDDVLAKLKVSYSTLTRDLKRHYEKSGGSNSKWYLKLQKVKRENTKLRKQMAMKSKNDEIHLIETGFVIAAGHDSVRELTEKHPGNVAMPLFCFDELQKLSQKYAEAKWFLAFGDTLDITPVFPKGEEVLYEEPHEETARRTRAIVSMAVEFDSLRRDVVLQTNSYKIQTLAESQGIRVQKTA